MKRCDDVHTLSTPLSVIAENVVDEVELMLIEEFERDDIVERVVKLLYEACHAKGLK